MWDAIPCTKSEQITHTRTPNRAHSSSRISPLPSTESHPVQRARQSCFAPAHRPCFFIFMVVVSI